jgi:hypothetical protein
VVSVVGGVEELRDNFLFEYQFLYGAPIHFFLSLPLPFLVVPLGFLAFVVVGAVDTGRATAA